MCTLTAALLARLACPAALQGHLVPLLYIRRCCSESTDANKHPRPPGRMAWCVFCMVWWPGAYCVLGERYMWRRVVHLGNVYVAVGTAYVHAGRCSCGCVACTVVCASHAASLHVSRASCVVRHLGPCWLLQAYVCPMGWGACSELNRVYHTHTYVCFRCRQYTE